MTLPDAILKAQRIAAEHGAAVIVAVADGAHGNGDGENRFDAVMVDVYERDQQGGAYLTKEQIVTEEV